MCIAFSLGSMTFLAVNAVTKNFGGLVAIRNVSFEVPEGQIVGLIGPNGAGKTTLFNLLSGTYRPSSGEIVFLNEDITGLKPYEICWKGIARTFQLLKPFSEQTVLQNALVGVIFGRRKRPASKAAVEEAHKALQEVEMLDKAEVEVGSLTFLQKKKVEIARALATNPRLLLLDEPMSGLSPVEMESFLDLIRRLNGRGMSVFVIEHHMQAIMSLAHYIIVLHHGEKLSEGTPTTILQNTEVISAYLGESEDA